jgi:hypothetical protein
MVSGSVWYSYPDLRRLRKKRLLEREVESLRQSWQRRHCFASQRLLDLGYGTDLINISGSFPACSKVEATSLQ